MGEGEAATSIHAYDNLPFFSDVSAHQPNATLSPNTFRNYFPTCAWTAAA